MAELSKYVWYDGKLVPWAEATIHATDLGPWSVSSVFEGIRGYWNASAQTLNVFQLDAHLERFAQSMRLIRLPACTYDSATLKRGILDLLRANEVADDIYIRPFAFAEASTFGGLPKGETRVLVNTTPWPSRLGNGRMNTAAVVSWTRISDNVMPPRIKASPNYLNSRYAAEEAHRHGYDSAILLNPSGKVAEGPGMCLMLVRGKKIITPGVTSGILESITRDTLIQLARHLFKLDVVEREVDRTELYAADEAFFCGTGIEIAPISSIDGLNIGNGKIGAVTQAIIDCYHNLVRGMDARYAEWRTPLPMNASAPVH
jgi:branched-chain amino acid aminotransferase